MMNGNQVNCEHCTSFYCPPAKSYDALPRCKQGHDIKFTFPPSIDEANNSNCGWLKSKCTQYEKREVE